MVFGSITPFPACAQQHTVRRMALRVAAALNDDLVAGVGQPVQGSVDQNGGIKEAQPLVHGPVAGDDEAGGPDGVGSGSAHRGRRMAGR